MISVLSRRLFTLIPFAQVDAFASSVFRGNPACVVPLEEWLPDEVLANIAAEFNLAETAFFVPIKEEESTWHLRWFTPVFEIDCCGHATLASAHILFGEDPSLDEIRFNSLSGDLFVRRPIEDSSFSETESELTSPYLEMDFPTQGLNKNILEEDPSAGELLLNGLGSVVADSVVSVVKSTELEYYVVLLDHWKSVLECTPTMSFFSELQGGVIVTASTARVEKGQSETVLPSGEAIDADFVSRFFYPYFGIDEDPVTGSAHTLLAPFWADFWEMEATTELLERGEDDGIRLCGYQASKRGGYVDCILDGDRTGLAGGATTFAKGVISLDL